MVISLQSLPVPNLKLILFNNTNDEDEPMNQAVSQEPPGPLPTASSPEGIPQAPFFPKNCFPLLLPDTPRVTDTHPLLPLPYPSGLKVTVADVLNSVKDLLRTTWCLPAHPLIFNRCSGCTWNSRSWVVWAVTRREARGRALPKGFSAQISNKSFYLPWHSISYSSLWLEKEGRCPGFLQTACLPSSFY